ncbi:hypothetical protein [Actinokineospora sp. NBRC 105648]|uniref:hypothetical protein n=1 Tax=Actinokineospora sp. NBRC 105648 TaxID=3032206 RepID=UPI0024A18581|nr:hypothetical protein [Actinokineospora sp. NBRC 105648]GLZ37343.1 hypothetical protein Acsp05_09680 [Actinokineospora sp. NBRC 105648]
MEITGRKVSGLVLGVALAVGAVGCTTVQGAEGKGAVTTTTAPGTATVTETVTENAQPAGSKSNTGGSGSSGGSAKTTTTTHKGGGTTTTTTTKPATSGAKIVSFTVVSKPACPVLAKPGAPFSSPGSPVVIAWKITGATGAAISLDSPGMYGSYGSDYPASGQLELGFTCDTTPGKTTHTYTVFAKDMKSVSQSLTVSATNNT